MGEAESAWSPVTESGGSRVTWYFGKDTICAAARKENWRSDCHSERSEESAFINTRFLSRPIWGSTHIPFSLTLTADQKGGEL